MVEFVTYRVDIYLYRVREMSLPSWRNNIHTTIKSGDRVRDTYRVDIHIYRVRGMSLPSKQYPRYIQVMKFVTSTPFVTYTELTYTYTEFVK